MTEKNKKKFEKIKINTDKKKKKKYLWYLWYNNTSNINDINVEINKFNAYK